MIRLKGKKEYQEDLKRALDREKELKQEIQTREVLIRDRKMDKSKKEVEIKEKTKDFNAQLKLAKSEFYQAERDRSRFARELRDLNHALADLPRKRSYCMQKIKSLSRPKVEDKKDTKDKKDGQGIEQLAGIV